ncbi:hypothetical protein [Methylobacterium nonmethylotrophicum]|uniref:Uncharacterized protein n=1 Tax=Methylobacterium nonmethylotrophicum TaxID=1141884 RepID=A0A4Z0NK16_9HYPH|nr:hypothetical protein [Methylobacterium nonmethylotrophicum]TGD96722.1 hypothetical protein EU555_21925 [Methylobacterium nonmethylotrophicum]
MTDDARPQVLAIASVTAVSTIDGGDTLAAEVSGPDGGTIFLLIPLGAAGALITQLTDAAERGAQERRLHSQGRRPSPEA